MSDCTPFDWLDSPWGLGPWGGVLPIVGGPLPFDETFDIFCVGSCGDMSSFTSFDEVEVDTGPNQLTFFEDAPLDLYAISGGSETSTDTCRVFVDKAIGDRWTFEMTFAILDMPSDFTNLAEQHFYIGIVDQQGGCAGLFFSALGIKYTGSARHDGTNTLLVNSAMQLLPDSFGLVEEDIYYTLRIALDFVTQTTYIFITEADEVEDIGHQLRYILPAVPSVSCLVLPEEGVTFSLRGTETAPTSVLFDSFCLGSGLLIPNSPPVADAGPDQAARSCTIVRLDGTGSFDPAGEPLTYQWRLIDGPLVSQYVLVGADGHTITGEDTLSNKFYTDDAEAFDVDPGIVEGDVLLIDGEPYKIITTGSDMDGYYVQVDGFVLAGNLSNTQFRILKQNGISGGTSAHPTFYPDVVGLFKFDLTVADGTFSSTSSSTIVNVVESHVPRGCLPDVQFLWNYISDFWRFVDGTEVIETFWGALAQLAASELLTVWQHEYSKSLRDIQRTHQRRWLHYDLFIQEPVIEQTTIRTLLAGVQSITLDVSLTPTYGGQTLVVVMPDGSENEVFLSQPEDGLDGPVPTVQAYLQKVLRQLNRDFSVDLTLTNDENFARLIVRAPFPFVFSEASTATSLFSFPATNDLPRGSSGFSTGTNIYVVDRPLTNMGIEPGDFLVIDGVAYVIVRTSSEDTDTWGDQRLVLAENIPFDLGSNWVVCGATRSDFLDFYNALCSQGDVAVYEVLEKSTGQLIYVDAEVLSAALDTKTALLTEHSPIAAYLADSDTYSVFFHSLYRRTYMPVDPLVVEIPVLQEKIKNANDQAVLRQNIDYYRDTYRGQDCIRFVTGTSPDPDVWEYTTPPRRMWAETTYIDNRPTIEQNFGIPADFTLDNLAELDENVDYLSVVRGLWYAYFSGPTIRNLRVGTQILLGLPFAEEAGTISEINEDFSLQQGRILIQDANEQAIVRSYNYPRQLSLEVNPDTNEVYKVGDTVAQFAPLVEGVEIVDYIKDPTWFHKLLRQGKFFEVEKFFKFLVLVDSVAFDVETLPFAMNFIRRVKPTYTYPVAIVQKNEEATVNVTDEINYAGGLNLQADLFWQGFGQIQTFDATRGNGAYWSAFDTEEPENVPSFPTPTIPTRWGFDNYWLAPRESLYGLLRQEVSSPGVQSAGGPFYTGLPVFTEIVTVLNDGQTFWLPGSPGYEFASEEADTTATISHIITYITMNVNAGTEVTVKFYKNAVLEHTENITMPDLGTSLDPPFHTVVSSVSIGVVPGDILSATFEHDGAGLNTYVEEICAVLGVGQDWESLTIGPDTFLMVRPM